MPETTPPSERPAGKAAPKLASKAAGEPRGAAAATIPARLMFDDVACRFGDKLALGGVSLDIAPGEILCLLGPSGCGKTTLLRLAAGIERPTGGRVMLDQTEVAGPHRFVPPEERNVGLVFQDFALFPHLSVVANVAFGLKSVPKPAAHSAALAALRRVGLAHMADAYPHTLSGGEQQRVALARAIAPRPGVLLMDEPFSGLDVQLRETIREETLAILQETRATCVIVTHDPDEALALGDRIAVMNAGRLVQVGSAEELYRRPFEPFVARFFSDVNEVTLPVRDGRIDVDGTDWPVAEVTDGALVTVCIRERGVQIRPMGEGRPARVRSVRFRGDLAVVEMAVQGFEQPIRARVRDGAAPARGAEVGITFADGALLVFPQAG